MATTIESALSEKRLVLANSQWAASLAIGNDWTTLRIGMRIAFADAGISLTGVNFFVGVLSNPAVLLTNGPLSNTTSHFVGWNIAALPLSRSTTPSAYNLVSQFNLGKRVGSTNTIPGSGSAPTQYWSADATVRTPFMVEITKGSPNYTLTNIYDSNENLGPDVTYAWLIGAMEQPTLAGAATYLNSVTGFASYGALASISVAVSEATNGDLNAVCVAWNKSTPTLHISEVLFAKMA